MTDITDHRAALADLGVHDGTLSEEERRSLDQRGFVIFRGLVPPEQVAAMRDAMEELFLREGAQPGGMRDCDRMEERSDAFDICLIHPRLLAAVAHILQDEFTTLGVHARPNLPGYMRQPLHSDYDGDPVGMGPYQTANSLWMLDDFTPENGATRVVPGSHRWLVRPSEVLADPREPHPDQAQLCAPAGSVAVYNGHLWHSAWINRTARARANLTSFWRRRSYACHAWGAHEMPAAAMARLPAGAQHIVNGCGSVAAAAAPSAP